MIWLNHHQAFTAIKQVNKGVHLANIALLFTTALIGVSDRGALPRVFAAQRFRSMTGIVAYLVAGAIGVAWSPLLALAVFVVMPAFYAINIPGMTRRDSTHH